MLRAAAIARRRAWALPGIFHSNSSRRSEWASACRPGELCLGSLAPMLKGGVSMSTLAYAVRRLDPELVGPSAQTPRETKRLSDLDDTDGLRRHISLAFFYRGRDGEGFVDPAGVIRRAVGEALVQYYPLAGRLRELEDRKLVVDCTGEGVLFVQADADVQLADLEAAGLRPPLPCWDQLLFDVEGSGGVLNCALMLMQVTRLLCGGFVLALRFNHTICDGIGLLQFMNTVAQHARAGGLLSTTVAPVWCRELLDAQNPPMPSSQQREVQLDVLPPLAGDIPMRSFTFSASNVAAIKKSLPLPLRETATTFETLAAFLWRAHTMALELPAGEDASLVIMANIRGDPKMRLPAGYYGNASVPSKVLVDAATLRVASLGDLVAFVRLAKAAVTTDYVRSKTDELVLLGRRWPVPANMFVLSDTRRIGFGHLDFGWGVPVFAGPATTLFGLSFFIAVKDHDGDDAVVVPIVLPGLAMDRFAAEVERTLNKPVVTPQLP